MANKVKFGLRNVYIANITARTSSSYTYATPFALEGAVNLTLDPSGDKTDFYADDIIYFTKTKNDGYSGTIEMALLSDNFKKTILGWEEDSNGALIENSSVEPSHFALGCEIQGDDKPRRVWYYDCVATRPSDNANTQESSATPNTDTLNITITPRLSDSYVKAVMIKSSSNETAYNSFFSAVYEKVSTSD